MATVFPQSIHHHPLAQRLDAHVQLMPCRQLLHRERRTEIQVMLAHQRHNGSTECLTVAVIAPVTTLA
jgi:hypothetical protein